MPPRPASVSTTPAADLATSVAVETAMPICAWRSAGASLAPSPHIPTVYASIVDLEKHLHRNGTKIVKIFLHLSHDEQRKRFLERIDEPDKNWKFSTADIHERKYWKNYMKAYEECIHATSTHYAPWYVVPADDKENARLIVSQIVLDALGELKMKYPKVTEKRRIELRAIQKLLAK